MRCFMRIEKAVLLTLVSLIAAPTSFAQEGGRARSAKAFVVDDRLSALRRDADIKSQVIQRLRLRRPVFIIESKGGAGDQPRFYRVAVTRRTRGWIHQSALAIPGRPHEDERVMKLIAAAEDGLDRIALCHAFLEYFDRSPLAPRVLIAMAEEADRAAGALTQHARKRLKDVDVGGASLRDYYLSDSGLDRYSKLGVSFDFDPASSELVYDGRAYRQILKRFPHGAESRLARERLDSVERRLARQQKSSP